MAKYVGDNVKKIVLGTELNAFLASAPGLELLHPHMTMLGGHIGLLY